MKIFKIAILTLSLLVSSGAHAGLLSGFATWMSTSVGCVALSATLGAATGPGAVVAGPIAYGLCIAGAAAATTAATVAPIP